MHTFFFSLIKYHLIQAKVYLFPNGIELFIFSSNSISLDCSDALFYNCGHIWQDLSFSVVKLQITKIYVFTDIGSILVKKFLLLFFFFFLIENSVDYKFRGCLLSAFFLCFSFFFETKRMVEILLDKQFWEISSWPVIWYFFIWNNRKKREKKSDVKQAHSVALAVLFYIKKQIEIGGCLLASSLTFTVVS